MVKPLLSWVFLRDESTRNTKDQWSTSLRVGSADDTQQSTLRVILISSLILGGCIGMHSAITALFLGQTYVLAIVLIVFTSLSITIYFAGKHLRIGVISLLITIYLSAAAMLLSTAYAPHLSHLGYVLTYVTPMIAGLILNWRVAVLLMTINCVPFVLAVFNVPLPQLPPELIRQPHADLYIHSVLFVFFNLCLPLAVFRIISSKNATRRQLLRNSELTENLFQTIASPLVVFDSEQRIIRANNRFLASVGAVAESELIGHPLDKLFMAGSVGSGFHLGQIFHHVSAHSFTLLSLKTDTLLDRGRRALSFEDVTLLKKFETDLANATQRETLVSETDRLTGLKNREAFLQQLQARMAGLQRNSDIVLVSVRLVNMRQINAQFGPLVGDRILSELAHLLKMRTPHSGVLGRVRGSVLAFAFEDTKHTLTVAEQVSNVRDQIPSYLKIDGQSISVDLVFGAVTISHSENAVCLSTSAEFLRRCELALDMAVEPRWRARAEGVVIYTDEIAQYMLRDLAIRTALPRAIENNELVLHFQPKIDSGLKICGFEALLRWNCSALGPVSPMEFIPIAEECGLISQLTDWVIRNACRQLASWNALGIATKVAVNISAIDLERTDFFDYVAACIVRYRIPPNCIEVEVTESALAREPAAAQRQLQRFHEAGIRIAIDDFGTGYSSLDKLVDLPISTLKIDRSFLVNLPQDRRRERVVKSIVSLAHGLQLSIVAEGVENEDQYKWLFDLAVDELQGYYFGKPALSSSWESRLLQEAQ